jgi:hypothetical protein
MTTTATSRTLRLGRAGGLAPTGNEIAAVAVFATGRGDDPPNDLKGSKQR